MEENADPILLADVIHKFVEEHMAFIELLEGDIFIGLVGLIDAAGAADHGRDADLLLEQSRFGAERDLGVIVPPGQGLGQGDDFFAGVEVEAVNGAQLFKLDAAGGIDGLHLRLQRLAGIGFDLGEQGRWVIGADAAEFEIEAAVFRHDVERGAALHGARMDGGVLHVIELVERAFLLDAPCHALEVGDHFGGILDRVDPLGRQARMRFEAAHPAAVTLFALMADDHLHAGRLADDTHHRGRFDVGEFLDQAAHPETADFLVMAEGEVDRNVEAALEEFRRIGEADADEALHVAGAAGEQLVALLGQGERVGGPVLAVDGDGVRMAREHDPGFIAGAERGIEIGLGAGLVLDQQGVDAEPLQVIADVVNEFEIGIAARCVKADEFFNELKAGSVAVAHHGPRWVNFRRRENRRGRW